MRSNSYWYLGLSALSLVLQIFIYIKKRRAHTFLQFLIVTEIAYLIEAVIYIFLGSYEYRPKLITNNAYYDSHMGALTSNLITVPTLALLVSVFQLNWIWIVCLTLLLALIEWLFVKLQIYTLHWWRIEYTAIGLLFYFPLAKMMYRRLLNPLRGLQHIIFTFLCVGPISGTLQFLPFMLFRCRVYRPGWFEDPAYDTSALAIIYYLGISLLVSILAKLRWKYQWLKYVGLEVFMLAVTILMKKSGLLFSQVWWDPWFYVLFPMILLKLAEMISRRLFVGFRSSGRT
jgi:hypothetical protein